MDRNWVKRIELRVKYERISEEKFGCRFLAYKIFNKEDENYDENLKIFKYLFSLGDEARIYLWNSLASLCDFNNVYENIVRDEFTKEEFTLFENIHNTFNELNTKYNEIYYDVINVNDVIETKRLLIKPCDNISNGIMMEYCKKNLNQFKDLYKIDYYTEKKLPVGVGYSSKLKFSIFLKETNEFVGIIELSDCATEVKYGLNVFILDNFRGKGYATETIETLLEKVKNRQLFFLDEMLRLFVYKKTALDVKCIEAVVDENNVVANKTLEKCGFKLTGKNYYAHYYKGTYFNNNVYCFFL